MTCENYNFHTVSKKGMPLDMIGRRFGRIVVLGLIDQSLSRDKNRTWFCECDCGVKKPINGSDLKSGNVNSCGCLRKERASLCSPFRKHGHSTHPLYQTYSNMKDRCSNKNNPKYNDYGGRGIYVCRRWLDDFNHFVNDMGDKPSPKHSLDRIDNNGHYSPENCRWATSSQQALNKRLPIFVRNKYKVENLADYRKLKIESARKIELLSSLEEQQRKLKIRSFRMKSKDKNQIDMFA